MQHRDLGLLQVGQHWAFGKVGHEGRSFSCFTSWDFRKG